MVGQTKVLEDSRQLIIIEKPGNIKREDENALSESELGLER